MRIRKNMKLSSMLLATAGYGGDKLETYVCPLNQSPWDVIPLTSSFDEDDGAAELTNLIDSSWFLPSPSSSSPSLTHQFAGEDNVSLGDSNGAVHKLNGSVGNNHTLVSDEPLHLIAPERSPDVESSMDRSDGGSGKSSYHVEPHSPVKTSGDNYQAAVSVPAPPKRGRPRGSGKKAQASSTAAAAASNNNNNNNPYEFYYYSGFGPRWGRKRGGDEKIVLTDNRNGCEDNKKSNSSGSGEESYKTAAFEHGSSSFDGFEFMEEDYDDVVDQSIGYGKKLKSTTKKMKRGRKPVKERSLKSLM